MHTFFILKFAFKSKNFILIKDYYIVKHAVFILLFQIVIIFTQC